MIAIINLEEPVPPTGPKRIACRFAAERARVESFNRHMAYAMLPFRTKLWDATPMRQRHQPIPIPTSLESEA